MRNYGLHLRRGLGGWFEEERKIAEDMLTLRHRDTGVTLTVTLSGYDDEARIVWPDKSTTSLQEALDEFEVDHWSIDERLALKSALARSSPTYRRRPLPADVLTLVAAVMNVLFYAAVSFLVLLVFVFALEGVTEAIRTRKWEFLLAWIWPAGLMVALLAIRYVLQEVLMYDARGEGLRSRADDVRKALMRDEKPAESFAVLLRPFRTSGRLTYTDLLGSHIVEFETCIASALDVWWDMPLISIGSDRQRFGAVGVSVTEQQWQRFVGFAMTNAAAVFLIPGSTAGIVWELSALKKPNIRRKAVVIMPRASESFEVEPFWKSAQRAARTSGIKLPAYDPSGAFFRLTARGKITDAVTIPDRWTASELRTPLQKYLGIGMP